MSYTIKEWAGNGKWEDREYPTMLEAASDQRVFEVVLRDGGLELTECCDNNFSLPVTTDQLRALAAELIELANKTDATPPPPP